MDIISTWIYLDRAGEESTYHQVKDQLSSSKKFQETYWKCIVVFFETSLRYNKGKKHILFTNSPEIPVIQDFSLQNYFDENNIEVIQTDNEYKVPAGYYGSWNNQFYEFSILKYLSENFGSDYNFLLLDSDCIFTKDIDYIFKRLDNSDSGAFTYAIDYGEDHTINGLSRLEMNAIFKDLGLELDVIPEYSGGEILMAKGSLIKELCADFQILWTQLLTRFEQGKLKFNEEAHVLSYYYYKYNAKIGELNTHIKRCWTNPLVYSNVTKEDENLDIWHLPAEKKEGFRVIFNKMTKGTRLTNLNEVEYKKIIGQFFSPWKYYGRAVEKVFTKYIVPKKVKQ